MAKAYSMDLRERVAAARDAGVDTLAVAGRFEVSPAWVRRLMQRRRRSGNLCPMQGKRGPRPKLAEHSQRLRETVDSRPDTTLYELREQLGLSVCLTTISNALRGLGLSLKKSAARI